MKELPDVTLISIDGVNPDPCVRALRYSSKKIRMNIILLSFILSILITFCSFGLFYLMNVIGFFNPLTNILFPNNIFYDFKIVFTIDNAIIILILNVVSTLLSTFFSTYSLSKTNVINIIKG